MTSELEQVETRMGGDGKLRPLAFVVDGKRVDIVSHGRHWAEGDLEFFLVMDHRRRVYQLVHDRSQNRWSLDRSHSDYGPPGKQPI
jgi:hypothetical protein